MLFIAEFDQGAKQALFLMSMKPRLPSISSCALGVLLLAVLVPFLDYMRYAPLPDWVSDSSAVTFMALATALMLFRKRNPTDLDVHPVELCLWFMAAVVAVEILVHRPTYLEAGLIALGALALAASSAGVVRGCVQTLGRERVLAALASVLLVGALLQSCIGLIQLLGMAPLMRGFVVFTWVDPKMLFGNIGQRNQYAHYLAWGLIAASYLRASGRLRAWLFYPSCAVLALMMAWSSSRLVIAYGLGIAVIAWVWLRRGKGDAAIQAWSKAMAVAALMIAFTQLFTSQIDAALAAMGLPLHGQSGSQRIMEAGFGARRRIEWLKAGYVFLHHPLFGVGWGGYAAQSVNLEAIGQFGHYPESGLFTQAHNFIAQLAAETGLLGTLPALGGLLWCLSAFFRRSALTPVSGCLLAMLMVSIGHSLFEYPLWYPPFLAGVTIMLALSPAQCVPIPIRHWLRAGLAGFLVIASLWFVVDGYSKFWKITSMMAPARSLEENQRRVPVLLEIGRNPLWAYESDLVMSNYIQPSREQLKFKREMFGRMAAYRPYQFILLKLSLLDAYADDTELAETNLRRLIAAYPDFTPTARGIMDQYKDAPTAHLKQITEQASRVYEKNGAEAVAVWASSPIISVKR